MHLHTKERETEMQVIRRKKKDEPTTFADIGLGTPFVFDGDPRYKVAVKFRTYDKCGNLADTYYGFLGNGSLYYVPRGSRVWSRVVHTPDISAVEDYVEVGEEP
jgi:hypothetical protein